MSNLTTTTSAVFIPEKWSTDVIRAREAKLVMAKIVKRFDSDATDGDTIHVPNISHLVANEKVQGVDVSFQAPTESEITINLDQHYECSFKLEDIVKVQSKYDLNSEYTRETGYALAKQIDGTLTALATGFSQTTGTYNTAITTDVILDAIQLLDDADVPEDDRHFVMKPKTKRDIIDIATYISNDFVNGKPVESGKLGSIYGVDAHMTTQIVKSGNNTNNMLFHRDALALAVQKDVTTNSDYATASIAHIVVTDSIWGVKELRDDHGVLVKS